jgi:GMP synthase (glutamine-hydrolysing)
VSANEQNGEQRPILIVKTGEPVPRVRERRGEFHDLIREAIGDAWRGPYAVTDPREDAPLPSPRSASAVVITGSAANVPNREPWMLRAEAWLREVVASGVPTFGICFGHQILAQALGGEVQRNPRGREIGTLQIHAFEPSPIFEGIDPTFHANVTHVDTVVRLPPGARSLARSPMEDNHAIQFTETCYGVQFHPEIDADVMRGYVEARREVLEAEGFQVDAMLSAIHDALMGKRALANFVRALVR